MERGYLTIKGCSSVCLLVFVRDTLCNSIKLLVGSKYPNAVCLLLH